MPRVKETIKALELLQAVGQRDHGHFDHDAHGVIGPPTLVPDDSNTKQSSGGELSCAPPQDRIDKYGRVHYCEED